MTRFPTIHQLRGLLGIGGISLLLVVGCGAPTSSTSTPPVTPVHHQATGGKDLMGTKALAHWRTLALAHPKDATLWIKWGRSAFLNHQPAVSVHAYQMAGKLTPANGLIWNSIGNVYRNTWHQTTKALSYYTKATTVDPTYDEGWFNRVTLLLAMNQVASAKAVAAHAFHVLPAKDPLRPAITHVLQAAKMPIHQVGVGETGTSGAAKATGSSTKATTQGISGKTVSKVQGGKAGTPSTVGHFITQLMTKPIAAPIQGVIFRATFAPDVTAVDVRDLSHAGVQAMNVKPHIFVQGLFLLAAKPGDHVVILPIVAGKPALTGAMSIIIKG